MQSVNQFLSGRVKLVFLSSSIDYGLQLKKVWYDSIGEKLHNVQERSCSCQFRGSWAYTS